MKGFGTFALIVGICWVIFALSMDVSVSTGMGRVNNLGLMADRQVHTIVGGMIALAGLVMMLLGGKGSPPSRAETAEHDTRHCPLCAETIKNAAIKCKHCGAEVDGVSAPRLKNGWVASTACRDDEEQRRTIEAITATGLPVVSMIGHAVGAGPFETKEEARQALVAMRDGPRLFSEIIYRDSVSGKYPPIAD
ncbi:zinc ribbon domain-containing protein [Pseudomonas lundensis]|uniref:zinc ribbon domain-containing protein n=1 Tax=Pseudomonas lundensis TaxID=86185 RepID=UPI000AB184FE|nr:zinc ribbon domain-containing protein [Pseudomonas lundensis]